MQSMSIRKKKDYIGEIVTDNYYIDIVITVCKAMKEIIFAGAGGIVAYMYDYTQISKTNSEYKWSYRAMFINMFVGSFVGYTIGSFIPVDYAYRDGIIGFSGVSAYTIIGIIESRFASWIIGKVTGVPVEKDSKKV